MLPLNQKKSELKNLLAPIQDLLKKLDDDSLKRTHKSLLISFTQMLDYTDSITKSVRQPDIKLLLQTYRRMAERFYTQFEISLLDEFQKRRDAKEQAELAIHQINLKRLVEEDVIKSMERAKELLDRDRITAVEEYEELRKNFPTLLQHALDKLRDEWHRVAMIAFASQTLAKDDKLIRSLETVVAVAAYSIGIEAERIVIIPGREFAVNFFSYLDNLIVLTIPIYSVQAPWEWSIFWHELAGHQVRWLEKGPSTIEAIQENLQILRERYQAAVEAQKPNLLNPIIRKSKFGSNYIKKIISGELDLNDLGGFEHQFERILANLPANNKLTIYEWMRTEGWCVDWFKELFEDAWSVLTIEKPFLGFFEDILRRHGARDDRHPPIEVRLKVASALLDASHPRIKDIKQPETPEDIEEFVIELVAQQILKFMCLVTAAPHKFEDTLIYWNMGIVRQERLDVILDKLRRELEVHLVKVVAAIQESISQWSTTFHAADDPAKEAKKYATKMIGSLFSDQELAEFFKIVEESKSPKESIESLLENKNYEQLLELSFYHIDFHTPGDVQLIHNATGTTYWVRPTDWNISWRAMRSRYNAGEGLLATNTLLTKVDDRSKWKVRTADWNSWFKMTR